MGKIRYKRGQTIETSSDFNKLVLENGLAVENNIVLLTKQNAKIIEELIRGDDNYFPFSQMLFNYLSSCYGIDKIKDNFEKSLFAVVREIDRDNSTNVWRYDKNRNSFNKMISYITARENDFFGRLEKGEAELPDDITKQCGPGVKSLSSKVCKYLCEFIFKKDNYYINDSIVRHVLLFYLDFYSVEHPNLKSSHAVDKMDYQTLYSWLSQLHKARNEVYKDEITKNELDHILWYCYKSFKL